MWKVNVVENLTNGQSTTVPTPYRVHLNIQYVMGGREMPFKCGPPEPEEPETLEGLLYELIYLSGAIAVNGGALTLEGKLRTMEVIQNEYLEKIMAYEKGVDDEDPGANLSAAEDLERRVENIPAFLQWLRKYGFDTKKVEVKVNEARTRIGVWLSRGVKEGDILYQLQTEMMLNTFKNHATGTSIFQQLMEVMGDWNGPREKHEQLLAIGYLGTLFPNERKWEPYVAMLPREYENILFYSVQDFQLLKHCPEALDQALTLLLSTVFCYARMKHTYIQLSSTATPDFDKSDDELGSPLDNLTYKRFRWAIASCLYGRVAVNLDENSKSGREGIITFPLLDLLPPQVTGDLLPQFDFRLKYVEMKAKEDYGAEHELTRGYDPSNTNSFVHFGMAQPCFTHATFPLILGTNANGPHWVKRKEVIRQLELQYKEIFKLRFDTFEKDQGIMNRLNVFIRVHLADEDLLNVVLDDQEDLLFLTQPTESVWDFLHRRLQILAEASQRKYDKLHEELGKKTMTYRQSTLLQLILNETHLLFDLAGSAIRLSLNFKKEKKELLSVPENMST